MNKLKDSKLLNNKFVNDVFKERRYVEHGKVWFAVPLAILVLAIIVFASFAIANKDFSKGINIGIDFSSGNILTVELKGDEVHSNFDKHQKTIAGVIAKHGGQVSYAQISGDTAIALKYANFLDDTEAQKAANEQIVAEVETAMKDVAAKAENYVIIKNMGATASSDLLGSAFLSVIVATALILIYVSFRFKFWSGIAAVCALVHDVLMVIAATIIFHIQINASFIAAVITIVAYSINDTIVIFDRVRENTKINSLEGNQSVAEVVNRSVRQSLGRSVKTSLTTLFAIVLLAIIGVASIKEFAVPVIFGLIAGTYSSIFIAPSIYVLILNSIENKKKNKGAPTTQKAKSKA